MNRPDVNAENKLTVKKACVTVCFKTKDRTAHDCQILYVADRRTLLFCNKDIHVAYGHKLFLYFIIVTGVGWIHVAQNSDRWLASGSIQDVNFRRLLAPQ